MQKIRYADRHEIYVVALEHLVIVEISCGDVPFLGDRFEVVNGGHGHDFGMFVARIGVGMEVRGELRSDDSDPYILFHRSVISFPA